MQTRFHSIDALRAAMMLLGLVLHAGLTNTTMRRFDVWPIKDEHGSWIFDFLVFAIHYFRMPTFFAVAGFLSCMLMERDGIRAMLGKRSRRILVPFVLLAVPISIATWSAVEFAHLRGAPNPGATIWTKFWEGAPFHPFNLLHLWFLYDLILFHIFVLVAWQLGRLLPAASTLYEACLRRVGAWVRNPWSVVGMAGVAYLILLPTAAGVFETHFELWPLHWRTLIGYFVFFLFGWVLYRQSDALPAYARQGLLFCLLAIVPMVVGYLAGVRTEATVNPVDQQFWIEITRGCSAATVALMLYGLIGVFVRYVSKPRPVIRYLADASYWMYLAHAPVVILMSGWMLPLQLPAVLKVSINLTVSSLFLLATYEYCVRNTWLGRLLGSIPRSSAVSTAARSAGPERSRRVTLVTRREQPFL